MRRSAVALVVSVFGIVPLVGCGSDPKPEPQTAPPAAAKPGKITERKDPPPESRAEGNLNISDDIQRACGKFPSAHFDFDSSTLKGNETAALDQLATCFTSGALRDRKMKLVGHTDPRGMTDYNFGLGQLRADSVAKYLVAKGMTRERIASSSQGELQASGSDEAGWARDRRVDVLLGD